jgi:proline racemase
MSYSFNEGRKELNLLAPQDIVATATASAYINVKNAAGTIEFQIPFGSIASTDSTGEVVVTIEASTAGSSNATESAIAFRYRLSAAVATDTMGAITTATAAGAAVVNTSDNTTLFAFVEPDALAALGADYSWLRVVITPTAEITATIVGGVHASFVPAYAGNSIPSST